MLSFWICAALLTVLAVVAIVRPLLLAAKGYGLPAAAPRSAADVAVYRDQITEIDADRVRGLITEAEAEAARIEIARRLLASTTAEDETAPQRDAVAAGPRIGERLFTIVAVAIPAVALALYALNGSPSMPGRPIAERLAKAPSQNADIEELVARVEAQLRANPSEGQGWDVIAPVYLRLERFQDATEAFRRAIELLGDSARRLSGLAESSVLANDGIVTEVARKAYQRILELEPGRFEARFGLALAKEQDGDLDEAEAAYGQLVDDAPPSMPWRLFIKERLDAIADRRGLAKDARGPPPDAASADAVAALPEQQRRQVIQQMVDNLAAKLKANGSDLDGWQRLLRSWTVLGDPAKAEAALLDARKALVGDANALNEINAFAKSLGLKS